MLNDQVSISFGDFTIFMAAIVSCYTPIKNVAKIITTLAESSAATDRIFDLIDTPTTMKDEPGATEFTGLTNKIQFRGVSFSYPGQEEKAVEDLNFEMQRGEKIALVGPSGSGKSTMFDLLARLRDQDSGEILFDGVDSRTLTRDSLLRNMAYVGQEPFLFNTTVENNICGAETSVTDEQIVEAAKAAAIHEDIMSLPDGYQTVLGERGDRLSGGQRQRLVIARALAVEPKLMVLDESVAALDVQIQRDILDLLAKIGDERKLTYLFISHDLSVMASFCNRLLIMHQGQIVERGETQDILANPQNEYTRQLLASRPGKVPLTTA